MRPPWGRSETPGSRLKAATAAAPQVTKVKLEQKQKEGIAEARSGRRGPVSPAAPQLCPLSRDVLGAPGRTHNRLGRHPVAATHGGASRHWPQLVGLTVCARFPSRPHPHPLPSLGPQGSVFGSGTAGIVCAAAALLTGAAAPWQAGFVASFTSKLSDTVSSEIGKVRPPQVAGPAGRHQAAAAHCWPVTRHG